MQLNIIIKQSKTRENHVIEKHGKFKTSCTDVREKYSYNIYIYTYIVVYD